MATTTITFRTDDQVKQKFELICEQTGMNMSTAFNVFMRASIREQSLSADPMIKTQQELIRWQQRKRMVRDLIEKNHAMPDELTAADYTELESGKFRFNFEQRELGL